MSDLDIFFPEGKKVTIRGEEFAVKPFVIKDRTKVLRIVSEVMNEAVKGGVDIASKDASAVSTNIIRIAGERLVEVYEIALKKDREWIENITIVEEVKLLKTILEVNQFPLLVREIREMVSRTK